MKQFGTQTRRSRWRVNAGLNDFNPVGTADDTKFWKTIMAIKNVTFSVFSVSNVR